MPLPGKCLELLVLPGISMEGYRVFFADEFPSPSRCYQVGPFVMPLFDI